MELKKDGLPPAVRPVLPPRRTDWTVRNTDEGVAKIPLKWSDADTAPADETGRTLSRPTESGHEGSVGMVSELSSVNFHMGNMGARTQLPSDTVFGYEEIADTFSEWNDVNPNLTPATRREYEGNTDILSEWNDINRDTADQICGMPFPWAPGDLHDAIPETQFEQNNVIPNPPDLFSQMSFPWTAEREYARVAQLVEGPYDPFTQLPFEGRFSEPFTAEPSEIPEPPLKRIRRL